MLHGRILSLFDIDNKCDLTKDDYKLGGRAWPEGDRIEVMIASL